MNILYLTNHLNVGGITSYVLTLAKGIKSGGHAVYAATSTGDRLQELQREGIEYIRVPLRTKSEASPKVLFSFFRLLCAVRKYDIDIIHSHSRTTQVVGALLAGFSQAAHISTCHGFFKKRLSRRICSCWGRRVIAISKEVKKHLIDDFGVKEEIIRVIHNGIDTDRFARGRESGLKKKFGLKDGPVVGIIARLSDVKGQVYLVEAMQEVVSQIPEAQLVIAGSGRMEKELKDLTARLDLRKSVYFIPTVADTRELLSVMDVFVMPSLKEGLGLALMEAMACGLPVVGSNVGGIKSLIKHKENGLLVEPKDVKQLSLAILELLRNKEKGADYGQRARELIIRDFSKDEMVRKTIEVYKECLRQES
ncbi:glycosyltransferase family 4 protein [Candidatus Omnitrophota bacterium]